MAQFALQNVRLSFPSLEKQSEYDGQLGKYEATFLMDKETQANLIEKVNAEITKVLEANPDPKTKKAPKIPPEKLCMKDGDFVSYDGYEGQMAIKASSKNKPDLLDQVKRKIENPEGVFYAGCYVDVVLDLWYQNNKFGRRVNANLFAVRFRSEGEAFGGVKTDNTVIDTLDDLDDIIESASSDEFND